MRFHSWSSAPWSPVLARNVLMHASLWLLPCHAECNFVDRGSYFGEERAYILPRHRSRKDGAIAVCCVGWLTVEARQRDLAGVGCGFPVARKVLGRIPQWNSTTYCCLAGQRVVEISMKFSDSHSRQVFIRELHKSQKVRLCCICFVPAPYGTLMTRRWKAILGSSAAASKSHGDSLVAFCMPILSDYLSEQDNNTIDRHDSDRGMMWLPHRLRPPHEKYFSADSTDWIKVHLPGLFREASLGSKSIFKVRFLEHFSSLVPSS